MMTQCEQVIYFYHNFSFHCLEVAQNFGGTTVEYIFKTPNNTRLCHEGTKMDGYCVSYVLC